MDDTGDGGDSAERGRRRRRWQLGIGIVAILAVGVAAWLFANRNETEPAKPATRSPSATFKELPDRPLPSPMWRKPPKAERKVVIDLDQLSQGPAPRVPWYADGEIYDGEQVTPVRGPMRTVSDEFHAVRFNVFDDGYGVEIIRSWRDEIYGELDQAWFGLLDRNGDVQQQIEVQATSLDGRYTAWTGDEGGGQSSPWLMPVVYDSQTGKTTRGSAQEMYRAVGFRDGKLLYTKTRDGGVDGIWQRDPVRNSYEEIVPNLSASAQSDEDLLMIGFQAVAGPSTTCAGAGCSSAAAGITRSPTARTSSGTTS